MARGRKRRQCRRQPNGQPRREVDKGTDELRQRREWLAQDGDPTLTTYPLGVMYANRIIGSELHRAGVYYAWLAAVVIGKVGLAAQQFERLPRSNVSNSENPKWVKWYRRQRGKYNEGRVALDAMGRKQSQLLHDLLLYDYMPRFLLPKIQTDNDVWQGQVIHAGLKELASVYGVIRAEPFDKPDEAA